MIFHAAALLLVLRISFKQNYKFFGDLVAKLIILLAVGNNISYCLQLRFEDI